MSLRRKLGRGLGYLAARPETIGLGGGEGAPVGAVDEGEREAGGAASAAAARRPWWSPQPDTLPEGCPGEDLDCPWDVGPVEAVEAVEAPPSEAPVAPSRALDEPASGEGVDPAEATRAARLARLRRMIGAVAGRQARKARDRAERSRAGLPGEREATPSGSLRRALEHLGPDYAHGRVEVARALRVDPLSVAGLALDPRLADVDLTGALFLDTETTGLGGGTGVVPFLVGLAWFEDGALVVEQLLLEELGEEGAMLARVQERVERASCLVTYNGKSYDLPLLGARAIMNRQPSLPDRPHLDLLHCSRRVYKPRLRQVRLVDMEEQILGFRRERDVDGAEIPGLYWRYLREGRPELLGGVIEHNANDVAALAAILAVLAERYAALHHEDDPRDQLARAKVGLRSADLERAELFALAAAEGGGQRSVTAEAWELLGKVRTRRGDLAGAREAYERGLDAVDGQPALAAPLHLELAKLLEHKLRDPAGALVHAASTGPVEGPAASAHRVARLERRLARGRSRAGLL